MAGQDEGAFGFYGSWRAYAPIAFTNLLLTLVTLGIYRFWATTRTRRYLWSETRFLDERLEWTGTGKELLIGFLLVLALFGIPFIFLQFGAQALVMQGHAGIAGLLTFGAVVGIIYLGGVARFRALRYRLSRTYWHGIRGGSNDNGFTYGFSYMWKFAVAYLAAGLLIPWAMMSLWNERWSQMSFGPFTFRAEGRAADVFLRFLLFYLLPFLFVLGGGAMLATFGSALMAGARPVLPSAGAILGFVVAILLVYALLGVIALLYFAKFFRVAVGGMGLSELEFHFSARSKDWFTLLLGDIALVVLTLGIGSIFLSYRHWKFFITHLDASGEISLSALTQSTAREPGQGEGLLDAFDIGAI